MEQEALMGILSATPIENPDCHPERSEGSVDLILALGGGTVMTPECAEIVHSRTRCIYLRASVETLVSHLENEAAGRPMLADSSLRERITTLMAQRSATYEKTAHVMIDTDGKSIEAFASDIVSMLNL
jgi:shikimate kinase